MAPLFASMVVFAPTASPFYEVLPQEVHAWLDEAQTNPSTEQVQGEYKYRLQVEPGGLSLHINLASGNNLSKDDLWQLDSFHELTGRGDIRFKPEVVSDEELQAHIDTAVGNDLHWNVGLR